MTAFSDLQLSENALRAVKRMGFHDPTPVQAKAIPPIHGKRDIIAAAATGTGKTCAFLLPTLDSLAVSRKARRAPRILVLTPTRELAEQISRTSFKISRECGHFSYVVYGGAPYKKQMQMLKEGVDILIATPGRLCDLIDRGAVNLSKIEVLIFDEADRMLDMGFLPDIKRIMDKVPDERQTLLFSATIDSSIKDGFSYLLKDPVTIQIAQRGETAKDVDQYLLPIPSKEKPDLLISLLDELGHDKVVIFARTKMRAEGIKDALVNAGFNAVSIHSDKNQSQRRDALRSFRRGEAGIIVATDVLARGIDVESIDYVINYDLPDMAEDYIHRIGRTGRAGEHGFAVSFVSPNSLKVLHAIESLIHREIPVMKLKTYDTDPSILKRRKGSKPKHKDSKRNTKKPGWSFDPLGRRRDGGTLDGPGNKKGGPKRPGRKKAKAADTKADGRRNAKRKDQGSEKARPKRADDSGSYNYTGYGDLRKGKKKQKSRRTPKR